MKISHFYELNLNVFCWQLWVIWRSAGWTGKIFSKADHQSILYQLYWLYLFKLMPLNYRVMDKEMVGPVVPMEDRIMQALVNKERHKVQVM